MGRVNGTPDQLRAKDYEVRSVPLAIGQRMVEQHHYSRGGSNTRTYMHGLFVRGSGDDCCLGITWWIPPTKSAAMATYPKRWQGVLALSRLVILPGAAKNSATFLLAKSVSMIDRGLWPCLVTYADEWQGHTGAIYRAINWQYVGRTKPERVYVTADGRMVSRKAGPKTRTHADMLALRATVAGSFSKHKYVSVVE